MIETVVERKEPVVEDVGGVSDREKAVTTCDKCSHHYLLRTSVREYLVLLHMGRQQRDTDVYRLLPRGFLGFQQRSELSTIPLPVLSCSRMIIRQLASQFVSWNH